MYILVEYKGVEGGQLRVMSWLLRELSGMAHLVAHPDTCLDTLKTQ